MDMNDHPLPQTPNDEKGDCYGYLVVQVSTARGAIPLEGAIVDVLTYEPLDPPPEQANDGVLIATLSTDGDGNTPKLRLPAPPCSNVNSPEAGRPYALYRCIVRLAGYYEQTYIGIPVYEGGSELPPPETQYYETETDPVPREGE